ncbi:MAG: thioredoxin-disulfide reductase [archaeon]
MDKYDILIVGCGPAGMTAGIYAARQEVKTILFESKIPGGQMAQTPFIENYPGYPEGIAGTTLSQKMKEQAEKAGAKVLMEPVTELKMDNEQFILKTAKAEYKAWVVIFATGAEHRKLGIPGEEEFRGKGVSYCTTCDAQFFRGRTVAVIGGGNTAVDSALLLSKIAKKVYLIHRREEFRADAATLKNLKQSNVELIINTAALEVLGGKLVTGLKVHNTKTNEEKIIETDGVFINIGVNPASEMAGKIGAKLDEEGHVKVSREGATSIPGLYAAGDVIGGTKQITTAVGNGTKAALHAVKYLEQKTGMKTRAVDW